jgi:hypothetical protein
MATEVTNPQPERVQDLSARRRQDIGQHAVERYAARVRFGLCRTQLQAEHEQIAGCGRCRGSETTDLDPSRTAVRDA